MKARALLAVGIVLLFAVAAMAADVTGKWVAQVPGRGGQTAEQTYMFKVQGTTLTGTVSAAQGENPISDGKIDGDNISFSLKLSFGGNDVVQTFKGTVSGNEIKFERSGGRGPIQFTAKKAS